MLKKAEAVALLISLAGIVCMFGHWPGAGVMITFGFSLLACVHYFSGIGPFNQKIRETVPQLARVVGIGMAIALIGIMFKLQHWPGSGTSLGIGIILCLVIAAPYALWIMKKARDEQERLMNSTAYGTHSQPGSPVEVEKEKFSYASGILKRALVIGGIGAGLYFLPWSVLNNAIHYDDLEYARLLTRADEEPSPENFNALEEYKQEKLGRVPNTQKQLPK